MPESLTAFLDPLGRLKESREAEKILPPVREILLVTLCGMIAGSGGGEEIEDDGESKRELLRQLLPFAQGIPSDDTRRRFFRSMDPEAFPEIFAAFVREWRPEAAERLIAMDGKTSRRSHDVSAFATEARMVLAPTATA